ncbi:7563_t:CDS:2 [Cetraspora pellucida]|uniref:7563_t:CDS:1 n=1 Tax=Cetraspora pellucida TaxID=1433469 RepID=A0ACA9NGX0_9GLOM|nr:7563_t:CDS:2 [Cetraspora pellucida]
MWEKKDKGAKKTIPVADVPELQDLKNYLKSQGLKSISAAELGINNEKKQTDDKKSEKSSLLIAFLEPVYHEVQFMKFYKATLENKDGNFTCSFGEKYLKNYSREKKICFLKLETAGKENKEKAIQNKEVLKKELTEKAKIIISLLEKETKNNWSFRIDSQPFSIYLENSENPHLRFLISNFAKNQVILDNNPALNHLKNVYVDLTKIDIYHLFKDIQERIKIVEK